MPPPKLRSPDDFVLVAPFDGIGGARVALEHLGIEPALYISIECDAHCAEVVRKHWPEALAVDTLENATPRVLQALLERAPRGILKRGLMVGGPPCQPFTALN